MTTEIIEFPDTLDLPTAIEFANRLSLYEQADGYSFDFRNMGTVEPFGMLYVSQAIRNLKAKFPSAIMMTVNIPSVGRYAGHMGFFQACGLRFGKPPGAAQGSDRYLPITYQPVRDLTKQISIGQNAQQIADRLALNLIQQNKGSLFDTLSYSFREIIRNVAEHSQSETFGYCAQYWPSKDLVEISIIDSGLGLKKTLSQNPHLNVQSDREALHHALMPGISGKVHSGVPIRKDDAWQNSGYGLYMNSRLCHEGGSFFICSGTIGLLQQKDMPVTYYSTQFQGTVLRLRMNTTSIHNIAEMLDRFSKEGEALSHQIMDGVVPSASKMSKLIREDFGELALNFTINDRIRHKLFGNGIVLGVSTSPHGEMLSILFDGGRRKRMLSRNVIRLLT